MTKTHPAVASAEPTAAEPDPLFGNAGRYNTSWSRHDYVLGSVGFTTIAARLPRLVWVCLRLAWDADRTAAAIVTGAQLGIGVFTAFVLLAVNGMLRAFVSGGATPARIHAAIPAVIVAGAAAALMNVMRSLSKGYSMRLEPAVAILAQARLFEVTNQVELIDFQQGEFKNLVDSGRNGASWTSHAIGRSVDIISGVLSLIAVGGVLAVLHPLLLCLLPLIVLPGGIAAVRASQHVYRSRQALLTKLRQHQQLGNLLTGSDTAEEIRVHDAGAFLLANYLRLSQEIKDENVRVARTQTRGRLLAGGATGAATVAAYLVLWWLLSDGAIPVAAALAAANAVRTGTSQLTVLVNYVNILFEFGLYIQDWERACQQAVDLAIPPTGLPVNGPPQLIEARGVGFTYPGSDAPVLSDINLDIRAGQVVALVGHNGSGKTTLAKCLSGLFMTTEGTVAWDGTPLHALRRASIFDRVALLSQDFCQWPFTAAANIGIGRHARHADALAAAIDASGADFVGALPDGTRTLLCRDYENGVNPSGGQWQRIALARAVLRDADLVILDEPTAALDPRAEIDVFDSVRQVFAGKTILIITHRLASVRTSDHVISLVDGRIDEQGTFPELMAADRGFAELYRLQADQYVTDHQGVGSADECAASAPPAQRPRDSGDDAQHDSLTSASHGNGPSTVTSGDTALREQARTKEMAHHADDGVAAGSSTTGAHQIADPTLGA